MQMEGVTLPLWLGLGTSDAPPLVVRAELKLGANGIVDAADERRAGVGLLLRDGFSLWLSHHNIEDGFGQDSPILGPLSRGPAAQFVKRLGRAAGCRTHPPLTSPEDCSVRWEWCQADGITDLVQQLLRAVLFPGLTAPFDQRKFRVHDIVIVGPARQADCPLALQVL
jgi:hypothetical protein